MTRASLRGPHRRAVGGLGTATLEECHQLLSMMLDGVYVDMAQGLVLGLKPKPEFLPLFNLGEPVTTGDSELVTGRMEQSGTIPRTRTGGIGNAVSTIVSSRPFNLAALPAGIASRTWLPETRVGPIRPSPTEEQP